MEHVQEQPIMSFTPVSPKVTAGAVAGVIAAAVLANISLITPDLFTGLGKWSGLVYGLVITIAVSGAGWLKGDPLRDAGAAAAPAPESPAPAPLPPVVQNIVAPAKTFPAAAIAAVTEPVAPVTVTPVYEAPAAEAAPVEPTTAPAPAVEPAPAATPGPVLASAPSA
jgi:hypothetical protein